MMSVSMCSVNIGTWSTSRISAWTSSSENSSTNWRSIGAPRSAIGWKISRSARAPALVAPTDSSTASAAPVTGMIRSTTWSASSATPPARSTTPAAPSATSAARSATWSTRPTSACAPPATAVTSVRTPSTRPTTASTRSSVSLHPGHEVLGLVQQGRDAGGQVRDDLHRLVGPAQHRSRGGGDVGGGTEQTADAQGHPSILAQIRGDAHPRSVGRLRSGTGSGPVGPVVELQEEVGGEALRVGELARAGHVLELGGGEPRRAHVLLGVLALGRARR